jgi:hypothetical protein
MRQATANGNKQKAEQKPKEEGSDVSSE